MVCCPADLGVVMRLSLWLLVSVVLLAFLLGLLAGILYDRWLGGWWPFAPAGGIRAILPTPPAPAELAPVVSRRGDALIES